MHVEFLDGPKIFVIHDFYTKDECAQHIQRSEAIGYDDAPITTAAGFVMRKDIRDNTRVIVDDTELAHDWWLRAKDHLIPEWFGWHVVGINERFRYYRYDQTQRFAPHADGFYTRPDGDRSHFTIMVYLNDGFEGGETVFHIAKPPVRVIPQCGKALVFYHRQIHEGTPVIEGRKYVLRTDVMYRRMPSV